MISLGLIVLLAAAATDWPNDAPGRVHRIDVEHLPSPYATPAARNSPRVVKRPAGAQPRLPPGFAFDVFARKLSGPRRMLVAPNGDVFITEMHGGRVSVMRPAADNATAASITTFASGLKQPFGLGFYPDAKNPQWLYVAETHRVVRYAYKVGELRASGKPQSVADLPPGGGHHTRDIAFSPDGKRMFVSVGSRSNVAEDMPKKTAEEIQAWEAHTGLGAAWDDEAYRANVLAFDIGSNAPAKIFATG